MTDTNPFTINVCTPKVATWPNLRSGRGTVNIVNAWMTMRNNGRLVVAWHEPDVGQMFQTLMGMNTYRTGRHFEVDLMPLNYFPSGIERTQTHLETGPLYLTVRRTSDDSTLTQTRTTWDNYDDAIYYAAWRHGTWKAAHGIR